MRRDVYGECIDVRDGFYLRTDAFGYHMAKHVMVRKPHTSPPVQVVGMFSDRLSSGGSRFLFFFVVQGRASARRVNVEWAG